MPQSVPAAIADLATLVKSGQIHQAKRKASRMLDTAPRADLELIALCARVLDSYPRTGLARLRELWRRADEHQRRIIAACAPEPGQARTSTHPNAVEPRWNRRTFYQAPSVVRREIRPEQRRAARPKPAEPATVAAYMRERAGVDDAPVRDERPAGYAHDYDRAAVSALRGTPCVCCWLERSARDYTRTSDDGLCLDCRELGRPGIPPLPPDHARADAVAARCAYLADRWGASARSLLRKEWRRATPGDRETIAAWVQVHPLTEAQPAEANRPQAAAPLNRCSTCGQARRPRDVRNLEADDKLCAGCRDLDGEKQADAPRREPAMA